MIGTKLLQAGAVSKEGYVLEGSEGKRKKMRRRKRRRRKRRRNRMRKRRWWRQQLVVVLAMIAAKWYWRKYILRLTSRFFSFYLEFQRGRNFQFKSGESDYGVKNAQKYHLGGPQRPWMSILGDFWLLRLFQHNFGKINNLKPIH